MTMVDITAVVNGLTFGAGTEYRWRAWPKGLLETPDIRTTDTPRAGGSGVISGQDWMSGRALVFDLWVLTDTMSDAEEKVNTVLAAFAPSSSDTTLDVRLRGNPSEYRMYGRTRGGISNLDRVFLDGVALIRCEFLATDPLRYAVDESSDSTSLATAVGGLDFSAVAPFVFGSGGTGNAMDCTNDGNTPVPWVATFTGPLVAPILVHAGSGKQIALTGATLASGDTLVVDSQDRTVLYNGTVSRYSWLTAASQWFELDPGANSVTLLGASGAGGVEMTWRSAWV